MYIEPIAHIKTNFKEKFGIPRQSGIIKDITGEIVFENKFRNAEALKGIEKYTYLWLIFDFSKNHRNTFSPTVRPPRLGGNKRVGVFATRSPFRPNNLGLSCVKFEGIKKDDKLGYILIVSGVDLLDNTPIYDIKPYIPYCDCKTDAKGSFAEEKKKYKIDIFYNNDIFLNIEENTKNQIIKIIEQDPKPAYKKEKNTYKFLYADYEICYVYCEKKAEIINIEKIT